VATFRTTTSGTTLRSGLVPVVAGAPVVAAVVADDAGGDDDSLPPQDNADRSNNPRAQLRRRSIR